MPTLANRLTRHFSIVVFDLGVRKFILTFCKSILETGNLFLNYIYFRCWKVVHNFWISVAWIFSTLWNVLISRGNFHIQSFGLDFDVWNAMHTLFLKRDSGSAECSCLDVQFRWIGIERTIYNWTFLIFEPALLFIYVSGKIDPQEKLIPYWKNQRG